MENGVHGVCVLGNFRVLTLEKNQPKPNIRSWSLVGQKKDLDKFAMQAQEMKELKERWNLLDFKYQFLLDMVGWISSKQIFVYFISCPHVDRGSNYSLWKVVVKI